MKTLLSLAAASLLTTAASAATLIVGNKEANTVSFIDLASGAEVAEVATGPMPHEVAVSPDGTRAMVVAYGGNTLDLFDVAKAKKIGTCSLGANLRPHGIVWTSVNVILATTEGSRTLTMVTSDCEDAAAISTGQAGSHMLAFDERRARAYVSNLQDKSVTVIDLARGEKIGDFDAAEEPEGIALTPDGKELWVANRASNTVYVLDPDSGDRLASIDVGRMPIRLAISPDGKWAVTSDLVDGSVSVIDVAKREKVRTIKIGGNADTRQVTLIWSRDGKRLFAAETANARIAEVDFATGRIVRYLPAGAGSDGIGWSPVSLGVSR
ncbi:beta-propeller fold lactonase family protein [Pacificimonas sp. WHA3]|uniref:Beta-propeller fold lactonase family protein n=1 Tax=Pacificimonas pallii TaxID=2827236 RepID=A0ABS6SEM9_9SPHN|nr:beta-propeller fold lactonase family protein [Pacificimonas pallii]MBV7256829.1 beta-propeller fold lactonase family protein [Pacificimonas pallii]